MGYDIVAYFDVDQNDLDIFIKTYNPSEKYIIKYYKDKYIDIQDSHFDIYYTYNKKVSMHEFITMTGTTFIRDDERFNNKRYHKMLEKKHDKPFPSCLEDINWGMRTDKDALKVAESLEEFFNDDENLQCFAEWLRTTAKYCSTYELSY